MTDKILCVSYIKGLQQAVLRIRITLMKIRIRILHVTLIRIWILLVTLIRTLPFTLMLIRIRILASKLCRWFRFAQLAKGKKSRP
jgi:hypothetical protein